MSYGRAYAEYRKHYWKHKQAQEIDPADVVPMDTFTGQCHTPYRQGDEYVCSKCRLRWDAQEDRPPCPVEE